MPDSAIGKEAEIRSETHTVLIARWDVCVALGRFDVSSGERWVCPPDSERGRGRGFSVFFAHLLSSCSRGQEADVPTEAVFTYAFADEIRSEFWRGARRGARRGDFWTKATWLRARFRLRIQTMARRLDRASAFP